MAKTRKQRGDALSNAELGGKKKGKMKRQEKRSLTFFRHFVIGFFVFVLLLVPVFGLGNMALEKVGDTKFLAKDHKKTKTSEETAGDDALETDLEMPTAAVDPDSPFYDEFHDKNRVNILLLGVNGDMTDTIMLGSYDMDDQKVDVISVPRDTYFKRAGVKNTASLKINAVYHGGVEKTAQAVSRVLNGIPINYYVVIDYKGVGKVVDAMGGVPMDVPMHMYYHDPYDKPPLNIDIEEGHQVLDGKTAIKFLRFRHGDKGYPAYPDGDIGRIKAQQQFIKSAVKQSIGLGLPKVIKTAVESVDSNISLGDALKIAAKASGLSADDIRSYTLPGEPIDIEGLSFWKADEDQIDQMLTEIFVGVDNIPGAALKGSKAIRKVM